MLSKLVGLFLIVYNPSRSVSEERANHAFLPCTFPLLGPLGIPPELSGLSSQPMGGLEGALQDLRARAPCLKTEGARGLSLQAPNLALSPVTARFRASVSWTLLSVPRIFLLMWEGNILVCLESIKRHAYYVFKRTFLKYLPSTTWGHLGTLNSAGPSAVS